MEFLKLVLVVAAVAIITCKSSCTCALVDSLSSFIGPRFSHSMTVLYPVSVSNNSIIVGVGLVKDGDYGVVCDEGDTDIVNFLCSNLGNIHIHTIIIMALIL